MTRMTPEEYKTAETGPAKPAEEEGSTPIPRSMAEKERLQALEVERRKALEEEEARLQAEQAEQEQPDEALAAVVGLARLNAVYYVSLRNQGVPDDVCKALTRDYAALSLSAFYGFKGVSLPDNA